MTERLKGTFLEHIGERKWIPLKELIYRIKRSRYLEYVSDEYYHIHTFWIVWEDDDFGSNQAVFNSLGELCEFIDDGLSYQAYEGPFIVEEVSSIRRSR